MTEFNATLFDGKRSAAHPVRVRQQGGVLYVYPQDETDPVRMDPLAGCRITPPLGQTRRAIYLPDGARLETADQEAVAQLDQMNRQGRGMQWVHGLESRWKLVLCSLAALVLCVWVFIAYGIPFLAEKAARSVPAHVMETVSDRALDRFESRFLAPTELPEAQIAGLQAHFREIASRSGDDRHFRLLVYKAPQIGANAFALPSGKILVTDDLIRLAENKQELSGVFAHEMAHVRQRHGLRMVFQNTGVFFVVSALVGDVASITSTAAALPTMLVQRGYSREFERQADAAAGKYLIRNYDSTRAYRRMLKRLSEKSAADAGPSMIATHPAVKERIRQLKQLEKK